MLEGHAHRSAQSWRYWLQILQHQEQQSGQHSHPEMWCAYNNVFDEVSVSWGVNDGHIVLVGLKFPKGDINCDTILTFSFQFFQDPSILEGALSHLSGLSFKLFNGSLVGPTIFVDQMASVGRLLRIYMSSENDIDVGLLSHFGLDLAVVFMRPISWGQTHCKKENGLLWLNSHRKNSW